MAVTGRESGYDLHTHTTASDGMLTPAESVALAAAQGLAGVAVTDHDTVAGAAEAAAAGRERGVDVVVGVEISAQGDGGDVHVLGLWVDPADAAFAARLASNRDVRRGRNEAMMEALRRHGFDVTLAEAEKLAASRRSSGDATVARPHIAELLVRKGYVADVKEAFDVWIGEGGKAYVTAERVAPETAAAWIRDAGGVVVLAHPGLYRDAEALIDRLVRIGALDGIEAAHADHDEAQENFFRGLARRYGLPCTGGSDFHGVRDGVPFHAMLGDRRTPKDVVERLQQIKEKRGNRNDS
ncbi:PHP domain-containing protein [Paenibacillus antri]|uniref:PHP domain-containing protein n=1 Tax=Paenibacillus antri TaxID=2582848 RepID=A0A5R9G284_9BACL|nr:PHP domain-containing protein [Paenibacillus antri]TLS49931.1 PHP domain-containing protein [Paenibacillus antri]